MSTTLQGINWFPAKGVDNTRPKHQVPNDMATLSYDWYVENASLAKKRWGYAEVNSTPINASATVTGLYSYYQSDGDKFELVSDISGNLWSEDGSITAKVWSNQLSASGDYDYTQFLDQAIFVDGTGYPKVYEGVAATASLTNCPASAVTCETHLNKLFVGIKNSSQVSYSATGDVSTWTGVGTDSFNFNQNDGQNIVALKSFARNELLIFKDNSMGKLIGYDAASFNLLTIDTSVGCVAKNSVQAFRSSTQGGLAIWADNDGLNVYDGSTPKKISQYIQKFWDNINIDASSKMRSSVDSEKGLYILSVPYGASQTTNNYMVVVDLLHPWSDENGIHFPIFLWRVSASALNYETNNSRTVFGGTGYKYYFSESKYSDNGASICSYIVSPMMMFSTGLGVEECLRRGYFAMESTTGDMEVSTAVKDGEDWRLQDTINMSGGADRLGIDFALGISPLGFPEANFSQRVNFNARSRRIKVKVEQDSADETYSMQAPVEFFTKGGGQRA